MDFTVLDYVLFAVIGALVVWGLVRGCSGELGDFAGLVASLAAGYFAFSPVVRFYARIGFPPTPVAAKSCSVATTVVVSLIVLFLVRLLVRKFISFLLAQPLDALLGGLLGLFKGAVVVALLAGFGFIAPGRYSEGRFAAHSTVVRLLASCADQYAAGAARP